ncbi:MAG: hypothetical protein KC422_00745 [Trueperaceae bacterium]|nr:hypothetical protein [Trueperaceae bacterium]
MLKIQDIFDVEKPGEDLESLFRGAFPWEILATLDDFVKAIKDERKGQVHPSAILEGTIYIHETAEIGPHVYIEGPAWIGPKAKVKHGAYLRGGVVLAESAEVGAKTEVKRSVFMKKAKAAHLNYVGDSVLGNDVNLGAGVKLANFKTFGTNITIEGQETGLRKLGALIGDGCSIGCNAVTTPGTIIGKNTIAYNCVVLKGVVPANSIVKLRQNLEITERT